MKHREIMGVIKTAGGSYDANLYPEDSGAGKVHYLNMPKYHGAYPGGMLGPECLLVGEDTGSSH